MELLHILRRSALDQVFLGSLPLRSLIQAQASVGDVTSGAGGFILVLVGELLVAVGQFAHDRGIGVVEDVERGCCRHDDDCRWVTPFLQYLRRLFTDNWRC